MDRDVGFSKGDWVEVIRQKKIYRGFVTNVYKNDDCTHSVSVRLVFPKSLTNKCLTVDSKNAIRLKSNLTEDDINELIDLSLYLKDEPWFRELSRRKLSLQHPN